MKSRVGALKGAYCNDDIYRHCLVFGSGLAIADALSAQASHLAPGKSDRCQMNIYHFAYVALVGALLAYYVGQWHFPCDHGPTVGKTIMDKLPSGPPCLLIGGCE